jgi:hypothetical protein
LSIDITAEIKHATDAAISVLTEELADQLGIDEVDLEWEVENSSLIEEILIDLREQVGRKAQELRDKELVDSTESLAEEWETYCLPIIKEEYEQDGFVDGPARREDWCNFVDAKCRNGEISQWIADNVDADVEGL